MNQDYEAEHLEKLRPGLAECCVLLKHDGSFPLSEVCDLALYGSGARQTVKGGTGSGEVNSRFFINVEDGLEAAGFRLTTKKWLDRYDRIRKRSLDAFHASIRQNARKNHVSLMVEGMGKIMPEPDYDLPLDGSGDTAVYVLSRISGEGSDREIVPGDVLLTRSEIRDILAAARQYRRFILVLNVGGPVDLSPVVDGVQNVLLLSQLGVETGSVLSDILLGRANPSGKLATSWAAAADLPQIGEFGGIDDTRYREGIYVGYRYYDSAGIRPLFPFGYGGSFTTFEVSGESVSLEDIRCSVSATVRNSGGIPGKQVLQLYVSKPETILDHPFQELAAFAKTPELRPEECCVLDLSFTVPDLASYDSGRGAWILEQGDYILRLGPDSRDNKAVACLRVMREAVILQTRNACGVPDFPDWKPDPRTGCSFVENIPLLAVEPASILSSAVQFKCEEAMDPAPDRFSTEELVQMSLGAHRKSAFAGTVGNSGFHTAGAAGETCMLSEKIGLRSLVMADGPAGLRLARNYYIRNGLPRSADSGIQESMLAFMPKPLVWLLQKLYPRVPSGTRILHNYATALPIGTALAQSWNPDFAQLCGDIIGDEMVRMNIDLWLAPALNIQRDIRCGRNFEYFSEDPLLSGIFAAALTCGVQKHPGRGVTIKHFAANNQERNRYNSNSMVSERAMREIYLRGFSICIRESRPFALMTSYNLLNGIHTSEHTGLLHDILRCEFGWNGIIMTDWVISMLHNKTSSHPEADPGRVAAAGGNLFMPGTGRDARRIRAALRSGEVTERRLKLNVSLTLQKIRELQNAAKRRQ